jgi:hypothetical protein
MSFELNWVNIRTRIRIQLYILYSYSNIFEFVSEFGLKYGKLWHSNLYLRSVSTPCSRLMKKARRSSYGRTREDNNVSDAMCCLSRLTLTLCLHLHKFRREPRCPKVVSQRAHEIPTAQPQSSRRGNRERPRPVRDGQPSPAGPRRRKPRWLFKVKKNENVYFVFFLTMTKVSFSLNFKTGKISLMLCSVEHAYGHFFL